jgi:hypothetical protein
MERPSLLHDLAKKYVWWKTPEEALLFPQRVIAQVMNIGDYSDVQALNNEQGEDVLKHTLMTAEAGQFNPKSWSYWHYRLGLIKVETKVETEIETEFDTEFDQVPSMPVRKFE